MARAKVKVGAEGVLCPARRGVFGHVYRPRGRGMILFMNGRGESVIYEWARVLLDGDASSRGQTAHRCTKDHLHLPFHPFDESQARARLWLVKLHHLYVQRRICCNVGPQYRANARYFGLKCFAPQRGRRRTPRHTVHFCEERQQLTAHDRSSETQRSHQHKAQTITAVGV